MFWPLTAQNPPLTEGLLINPENVKFHDFEAGTFPIASASAEAAVESWSQSTFQLQANLFLA